MSTFDETAHPRTSAGVATGGQFTTKPKGEPAVTLSPTTDPRDADVAIRSTWRARGSGWNDLPRWPDGVAKPTVSWGYDDGRVETTFWFQDGQHTITYWTGSDNEGYNSFDDGLVDDGGAISGQVFGGDPDSEDAYAMRDWMAEVHTRIDAEAYGVAIAASTTEVNAAVISSALGEPQQPATATAGAQADTATRVQRARQALDAWDAARDGDSGDSEHEAALDVADELRSLLAALEAHG